MNTTTNTDKAHTTTHPHATHALNKTAASAHAAVDSIAGAAAPAIERVAAGTHHAVDRLFSAAAPAAGWIESTAGKLNRSRVRALEGGKKCVQDHPFATVGAAIAVGALIALVAKSRAE